MLDQILVNSSDNIRVALEKLNQNGLSTIFVQNEQKQLIGIITDGILRRHLLNVNSDLDQLVYLVMKKEFVSLPFGTNNEIILRSFNETIKIIPLINEKNQLVDFSSLYKLRSISIASPLLNGNELNYITDCLKTNWISSQGKYVKQFEKQFETYHDNHSAVAVANGTVALHLALEALGIGENDEVLVPNLTFAASVNSIIHAKATPILVDVSKDSLNIDISKIENLICIKTKAIMVVHLYGNPCDMNNIIKIANKYNLYIIEDCAEALGSFYFNRPVGVFGDVSTFSFYGNKTITTGEGGMVIFKNHEISERARVLRDHGMSKTKRYWHDFVGYNYRLTNIQAAIGVAQFERLSEFVNKKRKIANYYNSFLEQYKIFQTPKDEHGCINSYWLYTCLIKKNKYFDREEIMSYLEINGIETRPIFYPMHIMPPYKQFAIDNYENSEIISNTGFSLPSSVNLSEDELIYIESVFVKFLKEKSCHLS
jgi:perosamine synthetase